MYAEIYSVFDNKPSQFRGESLTGKQMTTWSISAGYVEIGRDHKASMSLFPTRMARKNPIITCFVRGVSFSREPHRF